MQLVLAALPPVLIRHKLQLLPRSRQAFLRAGRHQPAGLKGADAARAARVLLACDKQGAIGVVKWPPKVKAEGTHTAACIGARQSPALTVVFDGENRVQNDSVRHVNICRYRQQLLDEQINVDGVALAADGRCRLNLGGAHPAHRLR